MALQMVEIQNFTGGLNLRADVFQLASNETSDLLNIEIDPRGGFFARGGMRKINSTEINTSSWTPQRMYGFANTGTRFLMLSTATQIFHSTGSNFTRLDSSSGVGLSITSPHGADMDTWGGTLYIATGRQSAGAKWSGSGFTTALTASGAGQWQNNYATPTGTHMPTSRFIESHLDSLWVANIREDGVDYPNRVRWSHTFAPESWAELDYIDIAAGGPEILGIVAVKGHLLVFKQYGIYAIHGYSSDTFQVVPVTEKVGVANPNCFVAAEGGVYFFDYPNGVFYYDGTSMVDVFAPLRPMILDNNLSDAAMGSANVCWMNNRLWLSVPFDPSNLATKPTFSFIFDPSIGRGGAWTRFATYDGRGIAAGMDWFNSAQRQTPVAAHPDRKFVARVDDYTTYTDDWGDGNRAYTTYYLTRWFDGGNYASKKMWKRPQFVARIPDADIVLDVEYYRNFNGGAIRGNFSVPLKALGAGLLWRATPVPPATHDPIHQWGLGQWSQSGEGAVLAKGKNLGLANAVQMKIKGPASVGWAVNSLMFKYQPRPVGS